MNLLEAVYKNDVETIKRIVPGDTDLNAPIPNNQLTLLHAAVNFGYANCVKILLEVKANPDGNKHDIVTPLMTAVYLKRFECVNLLIKHKANVNASAKDGTTSLHIASMFGRITCVKELVIAGANLDVKSLIGSTPLHEAMCFNQFDCAELLLDLGASLSNCPKYMIIPSWVHGLILKRRNALSSTNTLLRVLRKRFLVLCESTKHIKNRVPKDVAILLTQYVWATRFDKKWIN
jgi:ankyrin repeat protein